MDEFRYINFDSCPLSKRYYGGSEEKIGIKYDNSYYMLKFQKKTLFGVRHNTVSEYLGSHIYSLLGVDAQDTLLGIYKGKEVVACRDFIDENEFFVPFNDVGESTIESDKDLYQYTYDDIYGLLYANKKLTNVEDTVSSFFDIFIVDALLGNFDRHGGNWGFIKKDDKYRLAPVFDNGSCLYPNMIDEDMMRLIINDENEINRRIYSFPTSQIKLNGEKSSYFDVISSLRFKEVNLALSRIVPRINLEKINELIDSVSSLSEIHKLFYKAMIRNRFEKILLFSYKGLNNENL